MNDILRWVAFLPAAIISSWLAWFSLTIWNNMALGNPDSILIRAATEFISSSAMAAAFIYVGSKVAPQKQKNVAYSLTGIALVAGGAMLVLAVMTINYWSIFASAAFIFGAGGMAFSIITGELKYES